MMGVEGGELPVTGWESAGALCITSHVYTLHLSSLILYLCIYNYSVCIPRNDTYDRSGVWSDSLTVYKQVATSS